MNLIERKNINKLLKNAEFALIATDNGTGIIGSEPLVLAGFTMLVSNLKDDIKKEVLQEKFDMAFMSNEELMQILTDKMNELFGVLEKKKGK